MRALVIVIISIALGMSPAPALGEPPSIQGIETPSIVKTIKAPEPISQEPLKEIIPIADETVIPTKIEPAPSQPVDNETVAWNYIISQGYTREQTAGILGNLQQEHNFNTSDVPGGLGIAQWMGNRRDNLIAKGDYTNINVQLAYLIEELNGSEIGAKSAILASGSIEGATQAFQNNFERCNPYYCHLEQRIGYAYAILSRH